MEEIIKVELDESINFYENNSRVYSQQDLKRFTINPPPSDGRCECCGKSIDELKPFGKAKDAFGFDLGGELLVKNFRPMCQRDEEIDKIMEKFFVGCKTDEDNRKARNMMIQKYGKERAAEIEIVYDMSRQIKASWECSECYFLNGYGYDETFWCRLLRGSVDHS